MLRSTIPKLRNFPLTRTAGPALKKAHLPHEVPSKAEVIFESTVIPKAIFDTHPIPGPEPPVVFGNRIKRKHQDFGAGRNDMSPILCIDLFTMLDTEPLSRALKAEIPYDVLPEKLQSLAELWRMLQVQYTWRLNAMDEYKPFNELIPLALRDALSQHGLSSHVNDKALSALTAAFLSLPTSSDVRPFLNSLSDNKTKPTLAANTYVHANAPLSIMDTLITSNPSTLAEFFFHPGRVRSVDTANECPKRFKPHPRAYQVFAEEAGVKSYDIVLVTTHKWDVVGAKRAGWRVVWVDRKNEGWIDGVGVALNLKPDWIVENLEGMGKVFEAL